MYQSFYTGALGAMGFSSKLSVMANNLANINNHGFKSKTAAFSDLLNFNLNDSEDAVTELQSGNGVRVQRTYTDFHASAITQTGMELDFALMDDNTFFMIQDPATEEITYTRSGRFHKGSIGDRFYLTTESGKLVLDRDGRSIELENEDDNAEEEEALVLKIGVYTFEHPSRLLNVGNDEFTPADEGAEAILVENPELVQGALESSSTDMAKEMVRVIECQRAFSYALKVVTTADEIESTINGLRG